MGLRITFMGRRAGDALKASVSFWPTYLGHLEAIEEEVAQGGIEVLAICRIPRRVFRRKMKDSHFSE